MKSVVFRLVFFVLLLLFSVTLTFANSKSSLISLSPLTKNHLTGTFRAYDERAANILTSLGANTMLMYSGEFDSVWDDNFRKTLNQKNMYVIDGSIVWNINTGRGMDKGYIQKHIDSVSDLNYRNIRDYGRPLVVGYWILDDPSDGFTWNSTMAQNDKRNIEDVHEMISKDSYAVPTICGFGPQFTQNGGRWSPVGMYERYTPTGCDMVGLYIYSGHIAGAGWLSAGDFNYTMADMFKPTDKLNINPLQEFARKPIIGIPMTFGGVEFFRGAYQTWPIPNYSTVKTQIKSFCDHGATGIISFSWSGWSKTTLGNDTAIQKGFTDGINYCRANKWGQNTCTAQIGANCRPVHTQNDKPGYDEATEILAPQYSCPNNFTCVVSKYPYKCTDFGGKCIDQKQISPKAQSLYSGALKPENTTNKLSCAHTTDICTLHPELIREDNCTKHGYICMPKSLYTSDEGKRVNFTCQNLQDICIAKAETVDDNILPTPSIPMKQDKTISKPRGKAPTPTPKKYIQKNQPQ